jgi:signal transduction histidine kinase
MTCLSSLEFTTASAAVAALWLACLIVVLYVWQNNRFPGKPAFILTFVAMLWWLFAVGFDLTSQGFTCKVGWSLAAWPGITLLPIAWAFFIFDYTMNMNETHTRARLLLYFGLPSLVSAIALTNSQTHLLYGTGTRLIENDPQGLVYFDHGPLFFAVAAGLYIFVIGALAVLVYALAKAKRAMRPFLAILFVITAAPLAANMAYVGWGVTVLGFDPTPFMFAVALLAFSWLLLNDTMMDTKALGQNLLFYATQDPVIIIDAFGRLAGANDAAHIFFGKATPKLGDTLDHLDEIAPVLTFFKESGQFNYPDLIRFEKRVFAPRALAIESPIQTKRNLLGWSVSFTDITEREHSAERLREAVAHAEAANQEKSQFLAMISHELRTPMTSVKGGLDLALHGLTGDVSAPLKNLLSIAQRNSVRLLKLIDDVLDLQKLDLNTIMLEPQDLNPNAFLHDVLEEYEPYAAIAKVRFVVTSEEVDSSVRADPMRLKQVVGNVISNAVKFSPEGGLVECAAQVMGSKLRLSIQDHGTGIPDNEEDQVFGRFNQVQSSSLKVHGGSGLGMHIAKLLIERMGGAISYESRLGAGTTFYIEIPLSPHAPDR